MKKPTKIIISVIVAAGLFYGGFAYGQSISSSGQSATPYGGTRVGRTASTTGALAGDSRPAVRLRSARWYQATLLVSL